MSKLVERLEKVGQETSATLGFGIASRRDASTSNMVLVGKIGLNTLAKTPEVLKSGVDAIVVTLNSLGSKSVDKVANSLEDRLWGVRVKSVNEKQAKRLKEKGCDFVIFDIGETSASVLNDEDLGKLIVVKPGLKDDLAHALHALSIDGVFFSPEIDLLPFSVKKLVDIHLVRGLIGGHFLIDVPTNLGPSDLEVLQNAGVSAIVVDLFPTTEISKVREKLMNLPSRKQKSGGKDTTGSQALTGLGYYVQGDAGQ